VAANSLPPEPLVEVGAPLSSMLSLFLLYFEHSSGLRSDLRPTAHPNLCQLVQVTMFGRASIHCVRQPFPRGRLVGCRHSHEITVSIARLGERRVLSASCRCNSSSTPRSAESIASKVPSAFNRFAGFRPLSAQPYSIRSRNASRKTGSVVATNAIMSHLAKSFGDSRQGSWLGRV